MPHLTAAQHELKQDFLRQMQDGRLQRPVAEASGLPNIAYTCGDFYRLEQASVFYRNWVFAGFRHQRIAACNGILHHRGVLLCHLIQLVHADIDL